MPDSTPSKKSPRRDDVATSAAAANERLEVALIENLVTHIEAQFPSSEFSITLEVFENRGKIRAALERLQFVASSYCHSMLEQGGDRRDAIQYIRLIGFDLKACSVVLQSLDWPEARALVKHVISGFLRREGETYKGKGCRVERLRSVPPSWPRARPS